MHFQPFLNPFFHIFFDISVKQKDVIFINLDKRGFRKITTADALDKAIGDRITDGDYKYIFVDEVQNVEDFEPVLNGFREDGNCSISNSLAENCIRPFVIGRKNWLFSGSPKGAEASAGIYTLVETAKANGLSPGKYIKHILADMPGSAFLEYPEYLDDYLPWNPYIKEICT